MNAVTTFENQQVATLTPMSMIEKALATGTTPEMLEKLLALQERWEANQARKSFNEAFASFKSEAIVIVRNRLVTDGPLKNKRYAELTSFVEAATPALSRNGLSASWAITKDERDWIEVTCIIEHVLGGKKTVSLGGPPDAGGAKNALQARISTVTYLERATLKAACGLSEQGDDIDGRATDNELAMQITDEQVKEIFELLTNSRSNEQEMLKYVGATNTEKLTLQQYAKAKAAMSKKINDAKAKATQAAKEAA